MKLRSQIGENIAFVRDELERNYVCAQAGDYEARRKNIESMPGAATRQIEASLLEVADKYSSIVGKVLRLNIADTSLSYAGSGTESTVVTNGETVQKIYRKSVHWAEKDRQAKAFHDREDHMVLRSHMEEFTVPEITLVAGHPLRSHKRAVVTEQAYYDFIPTSIFPAYQPGIDEEAVEDLEDEYPGIAQDLGRFATQGLLMYEETGMLIDSSGFNNVVMAERDGAMKLTCLDGTPVKQNNESVATRIVGQLTALRDYLA